MKKQTHAVERTSPEGGTFIGRCVLCGEEGLTMVDVARDRCPNPKGVSEEDALDAVLKGET